MNKFTKSYDSFQELAEEYHKAFSKEDAMKVGEKLSINFDKISLKEFVDGMNEELEHRDITHGDPVMTGKIALAHLKENPHYYSILKEAMGEDKS